MANLGSADATATTGGPAVAAGTSIAAAPPDAPAELANGVTWRRLRMAGWTAEEAGNLVGYLAGLPVGRQPWTLREVERLLFLRAMVERGRIGA